jgi:hypothetical protein
MQIIQFPRRSKSAAPAVEIRSQCRSKNALLEAARTTCVNQPDAIFVLIEAHRNAWHQWIDAVDVEGDLYGGPLYPSATTETERRAKIKWNLLDDVFSASPTTIDGMIGLIDYVFELTGLCENEVAEERILDLLKTIKQTLRTLSH